MQQTREQRPGSTATVPFACPLNPITPHSATQWEEECWFGESTQWLLVSMLPTRLSRMFVFNSFVRVLSKWYFLLLKKINSQGCDSYTRSISTVHATMRRWDAVPDGRTSSLRPSPGHTLYPVKIKREEGKDWLIDLNLTTLSTHRCHIQYRS